MKKFEELILKAAKSSGAKKAEMLLFALKIRKSAISMEFPLFSQK